LLSDPDNGAKLTVVNCRFSSNRARGVLAHSNALIERCQFAHQFEEAILLVETTAAMEGPATDHTMVRNNEIVDSERAGYPSGAIRLGALIQPPGQRGDPTPAIVNHDVQIVGNHIVQPGSNAIQADATEGLTIENNRVEKAAGAAVFLSNVRKAVVAGNVCIPPAALRIEGMPDDEVNLRGNSGLVRS
jgi:hypothetical protein